MAGLNKVILLGNLGADPQIRTFNDGGKIATVSLATSESWKDKNTNERKEKTEWHNLVFRGKTADIVEQFLKKGSTVCVEGKITYRQYEQDGQKKYITEIVVSEMTMVGGKSDGSSSGGSAVANAEASASNYMKKANSEAVAQSVPQNSDYSDDLPF